MTSWTDVSSGVAGAVVFAVGALLPHVIDAGDRILERIGRSSTPPASPPPSDQDKPATG